MARIKNGVLGGFSGKAGSVIGFQRRGKSFIKGLNKGAPKPPTLNQLASRENLKYYKIGGRILLLFSLLVLKIIPINALHRTPLTVLMQTL